MVKKSVGLGWFEGNESFELYVIFVDGFVCFMPFFDLLVGC